MAEEIRSVWRLAWRKYVTDGVPSSGENDPDKEEILVVGDVLQEQNDDLQAQIDQAIEVISTGTQPKDAVLVATTESITLSGEQTVDGVLTSASRVLVKDQSGAAQNGIYLTGAGVWARATDADTAEEIAGTTVYVSQGTANGGKTYRLATTGTITLGTTALSFVVAGDQSAINTDLANVQDDVELNPAPAAWQADRDNSVDRWTGINRRGPFVIADTYSEAALGVDEEGTTYLSRLRFDEWSARWHGGSFDFADSIGSLFRFKLDGTIDLNPSPEMLAKFNALYGEAYNADYKVVETGGTSTDGIPLSRGYGLPLVSQDIPVMYGIIGIDQSFLSGVLPGGAVNEPNITPTALDPAGTTYRLGPSVLADVLDMSAYTSLQAIAGETRQTMAAAMGHHIQEKLFAATGERAQIAVSFVSIGGQRYDQLKRGTYAYRAAMTAVRRMTDAARAMGKRLVILGCVSPHGPANSNDSVYTVDEMAASLAQLRHDIQGDWAGITSQSEPIRLFKSVPASFIASRPLVWANYYGKAVLRASVIDPMIVPVAPDYVWPLRLPAVSSAGDSIHPGSVGQVMMGGTYGESIYQACFDVGPGALRAQHVYWVSSTELRIQFNQQIDIDTSDVLIKTGDLGAGLGLDLIDGYFGSASVAPTVAAVSSLALLAGDSRTLRYTLSAACTYSSPTLLIAHRRTLGPDYTGTGGVDYTNAHGPEYGPRCAIRSSAAFGQSVASLSDAADAMDSAGTQDLYHWACADSFTLSKP